MLKNVSTILKSELLIGIIIFVVSFWVFGQIDVLEKLTTWSSQHEEYEVDEFLSSSLVLLVLCLIFSVRRYRESIQKTRELQKALDEIKILKGIIPICSYCKSIRDDAGSWKQLESYVRSNSSAEFSHGVCPECYNKMMQTMDKEDNQHNNIKPNSL